MKKFEALLLCASMFPFAPLGVATVSDDRISKYYQGLQACDGTGRLIFWSIFSKEVPASEMNEIFASILDKDVQDPNNGFAVESVLYRLADKEPGVVWSAHLERSVLAQAKHKNGGVRGMMVNLLSAHDKVKYRDQCLSYLNDPSDERVRYIAATVIGGWPDGQSIMNQYVLNNQSNPVHADSVEIAKGFLK